MIAHPPSISSRTERAPAATVGPRRGGRLSRTRRGFTLLELVIVLSILAILALAAVPNIAAQQANQPLVALTEEVSTKFEYARVRASSDFRAYGVAIQWGTGQRGRVSVHRNASGPQCGGIDWNPDAAVGQTVDLDDRWEREQAAADLRITEVTPGSVLRTCFTPDGRFLDADTNQPTEPLAGSGLRAGELAIGLRRVRDEDGSEELGQQHFVIVPFAGAPRWVFGEELATAEGAGGS